jgi:hypothetical protein
VTNIVDEVFVDEYMTWAERYSKVTSPSRFEIFKQNYMLQMQQNKRLGTFHLLNEFGDMTLVEYEEFIGRGAQAEAEAAETAAEAAGKTATTCGGDVGVMHEEKEEEDAAAVSVEVELVSETEAELRRRYQQERRHWGEGKNTAPSPSSTGVSSSSSSTFGSRYVHQDHNQYNPKVEPLFTNYDNVARSRGGAIPGSLNDSSKAAKTTYGSTTPATFECRHKYTTGGTQFFGVKKRLVRWTPDMPR